MPRGVRQATKMNECRGHVEPGTRGDCPARPGPPEGAGEAQHQDSAVFWNMGPVLPELLIFQHKLLRYLLGKILHF